MSKVSDSYASVIRGVSQQVPHDRLPGQHWEQDNYISDPVRGLSRRHGSEFKDDQQLTRPPTQEDLDDGADRSEQTLFVDGQEYGLFHRTKNHPDSRLAPLVVVHKDTSRFLPVRYPYDGPAAAIMGEGISTITAAGRYILLASANRPVAHVTTDNTLASSKQHAVWVRGGVNSRKFSITITINGVAKDYSYTTLGSYYDGVLDTSDIPPYNDPPTNSDPNKLYTKQINDRVNAYNTKVNQHLAAVAKDISPGSIAEKLAALVKVDHPTAVADGPYVCIVVDGIVSADDGGNGDLIRTVSREITAAELVTSRHYDGKVVKVVPKQANALAYYLKAARTDGVTGGFGEVVWRETAGLGVSLSWVFLIGLIKDEICYVASSPKELATLTGTEVPPIEDSSCGDGDSSPIPEFMTRVITHMRMFQDRLMIIAGSTVFLSKSGDYFNFFRKSVLAVADDDPIEVFAQGTEDDVITSGVQHDRNVILCGKRYQYIVPGRENMTPRNPYVGVQATYEGANLTAHAVAGSLLFFCQRREKRLTLQQMMPGAVADRLDAFDVSSQLDGYLTGTPRQIVAMTAPGVVFIRTQELRNGFYVYSYLDSNDQGDRLFDSWSRWTFNTSLGGLMGVTADDSGLLALTLRVRSDGMPIIALDRFVRETAPSRIPYFDSYEKYPTVMHQPTAFAAYGADSERYLIGAPLKDIGPMIAKWPTETQHLYIGAGYDSLVDLTSPYIRDKDDKIILDARVSVTKLAVSVSNSVAISVLLSYDLGKTWKVSRDWIDRPAGGWRLGAQSIAEEHSLSVPVMKENKAYRARISSRNWLPLTISVVEWSGQAFTSR